MFIFPMNRDKYMALKAPLKKGQNKSKALSPLVKKLEIKLKIYLLLQDVDRVF
jgi:hypothetical protein